MNPSVPQWTVYIIQAEDGRLYTGITNNLEKRISAHQKIRKGGARFFHFSKPNKTVYFELHVNRSEASKRECAIKKMTRYEKIVMIEDQN